MINQEMAEVIESAKPMFVATVRPTSTRPGRRTLAPDLRRRLDIMAFHFGRPIV